ncbi:MAG TPA: TIGR03757 family integrating conjugative element protein [Burkholderiaceae bacterium]|nr:TIGR03757 family integrating conjugative element protein [Burkholderiaceae bacterium]
MSRRDAWRLVLATGIAALTFGVSAQASRSTEISSVQSGPPAPVKVEVFTNAGIALANVSTATVYQLDALQRLEAELSQGLPADEAQAQRIAQQRMQRMGAALQQRVANASQGLMLAREYGIERVPAVVIDGKAIVYGVADVAAAVAAYRRSQGARP